MITLAWYNVMAIIVGVVFVFWFHSIDDRGYLGGIAYIVPVFCLVAFYLLWGGIFWW